MLQSKTLSQQPTFTEDEKQKHKRKIVEILKKPPLSRSPTQLASLQKATENIKFFKELNEKEKDDELHKQCCQYMTYEQHPKGHPVIVINTIGDKFYIILSGSVSVHIKKEQDDMSETPELKQVAIMPSGLSFGELALLSNKPRMATIICEEDSEFLILSKKPFDKILKNKKQLNTKLAYLESLAFLQEINKGYLRDIYSRSDFKSYVNKQTVFLEGEEADAMYVVTKGTFKAMKRFYVKQTQENDLSQKRLEDQAIEVFKVKEKKQEFKVMQIMTFNQNEYFGEEELVDRKQSFAEKEQNEGTKRAYTVVCESVEGELLRIKKQLFKAKVMGDVNGEKYMNEHIRQKKNLLKIKYNQVQEQVDKFWKFLKEDRQQLKNIIELEKESKKRQKQVNQYTETSSATNLDDIQLGGQRSSRILNKKGSLQLDQQMIQNMMNGGEGNEDSSSYRQKSLKGKRESKEKMNSLVGSNRELMSQNLIMLLDMHSKQQSGGRRASSTKNTPNQFQFNQRKSLSNLDTPQQNKLAENLQKIIHQMIMTDGKEQGDDQNNTSGVKKNQNFFQKEVTITSYLNPSTQSYSTNSNGNTIANSIQEEKNVILQQLREQQQKQQFSQQTDKVSSLKSVQELPLQQQEEILLDLIQNHPGYQELLKQNLNKKYPLNGNDKRLQTISNREDQKINLMGLDNRDIPVSKYELFKDIIKIEDKKIEFKFTDDKNDDIMGKKQIKKQPYKNYLREQQSKNQNKIFENLKKKATKHLMIDANNSREEFPLQIEQCVQQTVQDIASCNNSGDNHRFLSYPYIQSPSLIIDHVTVPKSPQSTTTPYDSHRRLVPSNLDQIDTARNKSMQLSPKANPNPSKNKIKIIKRNLFDTVTQINKNEQKLRKGTVPLNEEQQQSNSKNKSQGEFQHPITVRSQAFMQYQQVAQQQDNFFEGKSHSYHNLVNSVTGQSTQQSFQKQKLLSMQSGIFSPIEEECGTTKNIDTQEKKRPQSSLLRFTNHRMSSPSLMYIQHENQSPDHKNSRNILEKFTNNQPEKQNQQRSEYYIGQVTNGSQILQGAEENQSIEKINKEKLNQNSGQKEFNLNLKSAGSHRILRQSQATQVSIPNQDAYQNISQTLKGFDLSQNTSISSPVGVQRKSLSLKLINGNTIMNNQSSYNNGNKTKFLGANLINIQNQSQDKTQHQPYTPVKEEDREDNTPQISRVKQTSTAIKTPIVTKFTFPQEISAFSVKSNGYGAFLTTNISNESPKALQNNFYTKKFTSDSLTQAPLPSSTAATRPTSGSKLALRPYSAINKNKECANQFFNTVNANNFVKSSNIKKQRLVSPDIFNSSSKSHQNLSIGKNVQIKPKQEQVKSNLLGYNGNPPTNSLSFTTTPLSVQDNSTQIQLIQGKSNRSSINQYLNFQQPLYETSQNSEIQVFDNFQNVNKYDLQPNHNMCYPVKVFEGFEEIQEQTKTNIKPPIQMNKRFSKGLISNTSNNLGNR